jgi:hypothetical protein
MMNRPFSVGDRAMENDFSDDAMRAVRRQRRWLVIFAVLCALLLSSPYIFNLIRRQESCYQFAHGGDIFDQAVCVGTSAHP